MPGPAHDGRNAEATLVERTFEAAQLTDTLEELVVNFLAKMPNEAGKTLYFKVIQKCAEGELRWIEIPEPGEDPRQYLHPAPIINLVDPATM